jgi:Tfp pilus assembly protein PilO
MQRTPSDLTTAARRVTRMLFGISIAVFLTGGTILYLMNTRITSLTATAKELAAKVGTDKQIASEFQSTRTKYDATMGRVRDLESSVTPRSYVPTLLKQLQALAAATNLRVDAVRPSAIAAPAELSSSQVRPDGTSAAGGKDDKKKAAPPPYDTIDIAIDATGTYSDTMSFLYGLTRFPKIISVVSAQMAPGQSGGDGKPGMAPTIVAHLRAKAFVFHDSGPEQATGTQASPVSLPTGTQAAHLPQSMGGTQAARVPLSSETQAASLPLSSGTQSANLPRAEATHSAHLPQASGFNATKAANERSEVGVGTL